jgi:CheY-like chemotaxis protein
MFLKASEAWVKTRNRRGMDASKAIMASVLVVDDHPDLGPVLARLLQRAGHDADFVSDGQSALDYARQQRPSIMILDIMMPDMTGFDVLRALRKDPANNNLSVVVYSALNDPATRARAMELGAQDFLVKAQASFDLLKSVVDRYSPPTH